MKKRKWRKSLWTIALAGIVGGSIFPTSSQARNEYTALGVGTFSSPYLGQLSNSDAQKFEQRMNAKGWYQTGAWYNRGVLYTDLIKFGNESDITYITSHGDIDGKIFLSDYVSDYDHNLRSYINYNQLGGKGKLLGGPDGAGQDAEWFIFASCYSLAANGWAKQVSNRVHMIFGYVGKSQDGTDTSIINNYLDRVWGVGIRYPETMYSAWINANRKYNEWDWAIIGHEKNKKEYIHGAETGAIADPTSNNDVYRWSQAALGTKTVKLSSYAKSSKQANVLLSSQQIQQLSNQYLLQMNTKSEKTNVTSIGKKLLGTKTQTVTNKAENAKVITSTKGTVEVFNDNSFVYSRDIKTDPMTISEEQVIANAKQFIERNGGWRKDLVLASVFPMSQEDEKGKIKTTGYTITFKQKIGSTIVDGDMANGITIGYDKDGVNFYMRDMKDISSISKMKNTKIKQPKDILANNRKIQNQVFKSDGQENAQNVSLVFYSYPYSKNNHALIPAYKVTVNETNAVYYDAITGKLLNGGKKLAEDIPITSTAEKVKTGKEVVKQFSSEQ